MKDNNFELKEVIEPEPPSPAFSIEHMDQTADPGKDFYRFAVGKWSDTHPIPEDKSAWGAGVELQERNRYFLHGILQSCAKSPDPADPKQKQIGDFYLSGMNTDLIEQLRFAPVQDELDRIQKISSIEEVVQQIVHLHKDGIPALFNCYSDNDMKRSSIHALYLWQGGLTLPSKDYYVSDKFEDIRRLYEDHVTKMFSLFGKTPEESPRNAQVVMDIEMTLAEFSRFPTELRDDEKNYNRVQTNELEQKYPLLKLRSYLTNLEVPALDYVVVGQPEFYEGITKLLSERSVDDWKIYLEWQVMRSSAPFLHNEVEMESFDFFHRKLMGQQKPEPRWKRILRVVDATLGEALGELYVREYFGKEAEEQMTMMVNDLKSVFADRLTHLSWMTDETKKKALAKFDRFRTKIGHPPKYRDYSSVKVSSDDYFGNVTNATRFEVKRLMQRAGKPVDRDEWYMTPPTVNAYFSPTDNEIVFPAGILQPPFFDVTMDPAVNYGGIGAVISHEITHGYDDQGRHFDIDGNLVDWWTPPDEEQFNKKSKAVVDLYSSLETLPGVKVNGELTLGENIADFGGVTIAYEALQRRLDKNPELRVKKDGFSPEQRFFLSWAQAWRSNMREEEAKRRVTIDVHAPDRIRAVIPAQSHPEFEKAFPSANTDVIKAVIPEKIVIR